MNKILEKVRGKGYNVSQSTIRRAIVIDDDKSLLTAITSILKKRGYEVYTATEPSFCPIYLKHE